MVFASHICIESIQAKNSQFKIIKRKKTKFKLIKVWKEHEQNRNRTRVRTKKKGMGSEIDPLV